MKIKAAITVARSKWKLRKATHTGSRPRVFGRIRVVNKGNLNIGGRFMVGGQLIPAELVVEDSAMLVIGDNVYIHGGSSIAAYLWIEIGDRTLIGRDCLISDSDQHGLAIRDRDCPPHAIAESVKIGDDVWLGDRVTVLKGVTIGNGSVVGAGSVVTKDIPADQIWAGNPARYIKDVPA